MPAISPLCIKRRTTMEPKYVKYITFVESLPFLNKCIPFICEVGC
uniref:Uncharacterized protein n=1 Tax=Anguilla anguilla TaxID=7936 RepID=A0A0E9QSH3_ANGAN